MKKPQPWFLTRWALVSSMACSAVMINSTTHSAEARSTATSAAFATPGNNPIEVSPPFGSRAPQHLRTMRSLSRATRRLYGLGLTLPVRDVTALRSDQATTHNAPALGASPLPSSVDLSGDDPAVGNQGQVNSCASWATGYTLLGWYANHYGVAGAPYAPMYVYAQVTGGANVATSFEGNFGVEQQGVDTQADYTQGNYDYWDQPTAAERANASHYRLSGYTQIYGQGMGTAQQSIEAAMAAGTPVVIGLPVYSNFMYATASAPFVDVPPAGATLFGGHAVVAVKYDANGLWIQNQWGTSWGLNGYAELSWAFVNQYVFSAYTISGFQGPSASASTATPTAPTATPGPAQPTATMPAASAQLSVSPASGAPGTQITINGSGFGTGSVMVYWNGAPLVQLYAPNGSFTVTGSLSSTASPGPRTISAVNAATGQQASATFTVMTPGGATATPAPPTSTPTDPAPPTNSPTQAPTATPSDTATTKPTDPAGSAALTLAPGSAAPGSSVSIDGSGFHASETVVLYWNGAFIGALAASPSGTFAYRTGVSSSTHAGQYPVRANGAMGDQASATFTVLGPGGATATPSPTPPLQPTSTPTDPAPLQPTSTPTDPAPPTNSPTQAPTATPSDTATTKPTDPAGSAALTLAPGSAAPGSSVSIDGSGFHASETVVLYWNGAFIGALAASPSGTFAYRTGVSSSTHAGQYPVRANGAMGDQASATFTVLGPGGATATPTDPAPAPPTSTPTQNPTPSGGIPTSGTTSNGCQITQASGQAEAQLITLLNQHRAAAGVAPLTLNPSLSVVSRTHSCDMFLHQQMSHTGSDGSNPFQRMAAGGFGMPPYHTEGENIGAAWGQATGDAVMTIDNSMMSEPLTPGDHHWNIVNSGYTIVGVGIIAANGQTWLTEDFAG